MISRHWHRRTIGNTNPGPVRAERKPIRVPVFRSFPTFKKFLISIMCVRLGTEPYVALRVQGAVKFPHDITVTVIDV